MKLRRRIVIAFVMILFVPVTLMLQAIYKTGEFRKEAMLTEAGPEVEAYTQMVTQSVLSLVILMIVLAVVMAIWLYRSVLQPITALRVSMNRMKEGDLDAPVPHEGDDEIDELCADFEDMRRHMKTLLEEKMAHEEEQKELISNISHDLKTPLTAIKGYAEGLLEGVAATPEKQEKYVRTIYQKANEMTTLVDELSMYTKIDSGTVPYNFLNLNLHEYLSDSVEDLKMDLELQNMDLAYFPDADQGVEVIADPEQLARVLGNIITNAVKYRDPEKKGLICIRTKDAGAYVRVEIEDNGKGISQKDLPNIFDRFYRTDASRNSRTGGSGLGLAIVKKIVEDHGGRIWAESTEGTGTTMILMLRKVHPGEMPDDPGVQREEPREDSGEMSPEKLLKQASKDAKQEARRERRNLK